MPNPEIVANWYTVQKKIGLLGHPISHSKSPALFKAAYPGAPFTYELIEADTLEKGMERFREEGFCGANVTAPYKDSIFQYITHPDRVSSLLRSANIILRGPGTEIRSYNSDYLGVKETVLQLLSGEIGSKEGWNATQETISRSFRQRAQKTALVVGAGGAGKAAALALADLGMNVVLANRTPEKAIQFAEVLRREHGPGAANNRSFTGISLIQIPEYIGQCCLIVYALSFQIPELPHHLLEGKIIFEANYGHPCFAPLPEGANAPYAYIGGKYWLYNQAVPAFQLFTGIAPDKEKMWDVF